MTTNNPDPRMSRYQKMMLNDQEHTPTLEASAHRQVQRACKVLNGPSTPSMPVLWYRLIRDAERLWVQTGWGLANVWDAIHAENYFVAQEQLRGLQNRWAEVQANGTAHLEADVMPGDTTPPCISPQCIIDHHTTMHTR